MVRLGLDHFFRVQEMVRVGLDLTTHCSYRLLGSHEANGDLVLRQPMANQKSHLGYEMVLEFLPRNAPQGQTSTPDESSSEQCMRITESRFDLGIAIRLHILLF